MVTRLRRRGKAKPEMSLPLLTEGDIPSSLGRAAADVSFFVHPPLRKKSHRRVRLAGLITLTVLVIGFSAGFVYESTASEYLFPGTRIGGVRVGSRSLDDATARLSKALVDPLRAPMTITADDARITVTPWDLGMRVDVAAAVEDTYARQRGLPIAQRVWKRVIGERKPTPLRPALEEGLLRQAAAGLVKGIDQEVQDAQLVVEDGKLSVVPHKVGRRVSAKQVPALVVDALTTGSRRVDLPVRLTQPELRTQDFDRVIVVSTNANTLDLYVKGKVRKSYRVATGTGGYPTPRGQFSITQKRRNPGWSNPGSEWAQGMPDYIPPGPYNPLGTRALNLSASGIRIHGTPHAWSIGSNASHGCIRMHMRDAEALFEMVDVGTPVVIVR